MSNPRALCIAITGACLAIAQLAHAADAKPGSSPAPSGLIFDARWRSEWVNDDAFAKEADGMTLRLRLGYRTPVKSGWSGVVEFEGTTHLAGENFNSTANHRATYPTIADPDNSELNQLYLMYAPNAANRITLGRQLVNYDNQRFFGASAWRQNEQTFDALDVQHRFGNGLSLRYSYLDRVQRVFGADNPTASLARWQLNAHLLSLGHALGPGTLTGYAHFIENQTLPLTSHRNLGLRYSGKHDSPDGIGWLANLEYAHQQRYADGNPNINADYYLLEGGIVWHANTFKGGLEHLGGNGSYAFQTPFATLHAFDGWADRFLTTPANGLQDGYLGWSRKFGQVSANVTWHDFRSTHNSIHYGDELDASLGWAFAPKWNALIKLADFRKKDIGADVNKTWLGVEYVY
jgi:hypothetical protein